jgi:hypothetical protein
LLFGQHDFALAVNGFPRGDPWVALWRLPAPDPLLVDATGRDGILRMGHSPRNFRTLARLP